MNQFLTLILVLCLSGIHASHTKSDFIATALSGMMLIEKIEQLYQKKSKHRAEENVVEK